MKKLLTALIILLLMMVPLALVSCDENDKNGDQSTQETPSAGTPHVCVGETWTVTTEPTCSKDGEQQFLCSCGEIVQTEAIPAGHTKKVIPGIPATCTEAGVSDGIYCSVCETVLLEQQTVPARHTEVIDAAIAPTCSAVGLTEGKHCSGCDKIFVAQEEIAKLAHTEEIIPAVSATDTTAGLNSGVKCSVCKEILVAQIASTVGLKFALQDYDEAYTVIEFGTATDDYDIVIPKFYKNLLVTSIGDSAFSWCTGLTSITIPDSVTSIGDKAFSTCSSLTSITFTGTMAEWAAIEKGNYWNYNTSNYTVYCSDGDITKANS